MSWSKRTNSVTIWGDDGTSGMGGVCDERECVTYGKCGVGVLGGEGGGAGGLNGGGGGGGVGRCRIWERAWLCDMCENWGSVRLTFVVGRRSSEDKLRAIRRPMPSLPRLTRRTLEARGRSGAGAAVLAAVALPALDSSPSWKIYLRRDMGIVDQTCAGAQGNKWQTRECD